MPATGTRIPLKIERIVPGGDGMGRHEGRAVFVPLSAIGDELEITVVEERPDYLRGEIAAISSPGPGRQAPECPHYGECGGCNMMHLSYEAQLEAKLGIVRDAWKRSGGLVPARSVGGHDDGVGIMGGESGAPDAESALAGLAAAPSAPFGYRNRAQFHLDSKKRLGYARRDSSRVVPVAACPILVPSLERWLKESGRSEAWGKRSARMAAKDRFVAFGYNDDVFIEGIATKLCVDIDGRPLSFDVGGFFQSNLSMVKSLAAAVCDGMSGARAADLYCGVGLFGAFLKDSFERLTCVEHDQRALAYACANVGKAADYSAISLEEWTKSAQARERFDYVVLDPPRAGLGSPVRSWLASSRPETIGYVSCDPVSLARDAGFLVRSGYVVDGLRLFDFYPQTSHVESYARFRLG